ncbi:MAG: T9SS type A sorting domain-containing protein [Cryomorphaceae bacterium]
MFKVRYGADEIDVGLFESDYVPIQNTDLSEKYLIYNQNLEFQEMFELMDMTRSLPPIQLRGDKLYLGFDIAHFLLFLIPPYQIPELEALPPLQSDFEQTSISNMVLSYDLVEDELSEVFSVSGLELVTSPSAGYGLNEPWSGLVNYSGLGTYRFESAPMVVLNDSLMVFNFHAYGTHNLNGLQNLSTSNNQISLGIVNKNLATGETEITALGASGKNLITYGLFPSEVPDSYFRLGFVQGENVPFNQAGEVFPYSPDVNTGVVFLARDNSEGNTEWAVPLYSYTNQLYGTLATPELPNNANFKAGPDLGAPIELSGNVYVPERSRFRLTNGNDDQPEPDSLIFTDFFGVQTTNHPYIQGYNNSGDPESWRIEKPQSTIRVIDSGGNPSRILKFTDNSLKAIGSWPDFNHLFRLGDSLVWVNQYKNAADTSFQIINATSANMADTFDLDLPAGQGVFLLWLNENLSIVDTWIFPYENASADFAFEINHVQSIHSDSILVQGRYESGTSLNLDIFGDSPWETYDAAGGFIAVYGDGEPVSTRENSPAKELAIYPNPAKSSIQITGITESGEFQIFDISGRLVISERVLPRGEPARLDISALSPGVYTAVFRGATTSGAGKFVKQ